VLVAIEVKYLSGVDLEKDLEQNWLRINQANKHLKATSLVQCLLVPEVLKANEKVKSVGHQVVHLTWEQFMRETESPVAQMSHPFARYSYHLLTVALHLLH